jgi:hypothetical protein
MHVRGTRTCACRQQVAILLQAQSCAALSCSESAVDKAMHVRIGAWHAGTKASVVASRSGCTETVCAGYCGESATVDKEMHMRGLEGVAMLELLLVGAHAPGCTKTVLTGLPGSLQWDENGITWIEACAC